MTKMNFSEFEDREVARDWLSGCGDMPAEDIDLMTASVALAGLELPSADMPSYGPHIDDLVASARKRLGKDPELEEIADAVAGALYADHGYDGDLATYDDIQNANLLRVIDRRKGLPITLSILYIHIIKALGVDAEGVNFPGHFVVRLIDGPTRLLVDPFNKGAVIDAAQLRVFLKAAEGEDAELKPSHYAAATNRDILLRLQNNIKLRLIQAGEMEKALEVVATMLLFAPNEPAIWHASGVLNAEVGRINAAIQALQTVTRMDPNGAYQPKVAALMLALRKRLN
jgi:regulator of sirC expression with transglutaminase-like and TPR domain